MDGSHNGQLPQWADGMAGQDQDSWNQNRASMMFNDTPENMNMMESTSQWQANPNASAALNHYQQAQSFTPQNSQQHVYQNGPWIGQGSSSMELGVNSGNSMYGSVPQNGHHIQYSQPTNGNVYATQAAAQQQTQPLKHMPQVQYHQALTNNRMQHNDSPVPLQQAGQNQAVPVSYSPIQQLPQQPQAQGNQNSMLQSLQQPNPHPHVIQGQYRPSPQTVAKQAISQSQLQYPQARTSNGHAQQIAGTAFQPPQQTSTPAPATPQPVNLAPATSYNLAPAQPSKPIFRFIEESSIPGAKVYFKPATHLILGNSSKLVPAFNYKFKVVEARNNTSGKPVLGSQSLPCEIERDSGRAYRDCATAADVIPKQQENALDKYREAMKEIGRPVTDLSRGPAKRKERTSTLATASTSSDEYSESEDDDELPPPPLDGPRPGADRPLERVVWDTLNIVWTREDVPPKDETRRRFIEFGDFILRLSKDFVKLIKEGERDFNTRQAQGLLRAVEATCDYATPYILKHLGETDKALGALANCLLALYNKGYKDDETRGHVVSILGLLSEFGTVSDARYEDIRLAKIVPRMAKRFGGEVEELRQKIEKKLWKKEGGGDSPPPSGKPLTHAAVTTSSQVAASASKTPALSSSAKGGSEDKKPTDGQNKPAKRAREDDNVNDAPAAKKSTGEGRIKKIAAPAAQTSTTKLPKTGLLPGKLPGKPATTSKSPAVSTVGKTVSSAASESATRKSASVAKTEKKQPPSGGDNSASRLGALLNSISSSAAAKVEATKKKKEASETPEQREKRLRREKRGAHRVRWKEDDMLVEVRTFITDEEATGRSAGRAGANRHRDEGEVLKSASKHKDVEDDDALALLTADWTSPPSLYNLSQLPSETLQNLAFRHKEVIVDNVDTDTGIAPIDGTPDLVVPELRKSANGTEEYFAVIRDPELAEETAEQKERKQYENTVLMVAYQSWEDIPKTPRSPTRAHADVAMPDAPKQITLADSEASKEVLRRFQDIKTQGRDAARDSGLRRLGKAPLSQPSSASMNPNLMDALARLGAFNSATQAPPAPPTSAVPVQPQASRITDPRALASVQNVPARTFATHAERDAEVVRLLTALQGRPSYELDFPYEPRATAELHPAVQRAEEYLTPIFAGFADIPPQPNEPPAHIRANTARVREWFDGIRNNEEAERRERNMQKAKDVCVAIKSWSDRSAAAQSPQPAEAASTPAVDHAAAWHAYNTMSADEYAAWWQRNSQQIGGAPQQAPQQAAASQDLANGYGAYDYLQSQNHQQPSAASQFAPAQQAATALPDSLQAAQNDPNFAQYLQMAYALQAQQAQDGTASQHSQVQPDTHPRSPPAADHRDSMHSVAGRNNNHNDHGLNRHDNTHHQSRKKDRHHKPIKTSLIGTKPCTFYRKGKCTKGASCTYRHD